MTDTRLREILDKLRKLRLEKQKNGYCPDNSEYFIELLQLLKTELDTNNIIFSNSFYTNTEEDQQVLTKNRKHLRVIKGGKCKSRIKNFQYPAFEETD